MNRSPEHSLTPTPTEPIVSELRALADQFELVTPLSANPLDKLASTWYKNQHGDLVTLGKDETGGVHATVTDTAGHRMVTLEATISPLDNPYSQGRYKLSDERQSSYFDEAPDETLELMAELIQPAEPNKN